LLARRAQVVLACGGALEQLYRTPACDVSVHSISTNQFDPAQSGGCRIHSRFMVLQSSSQSRLPGAPRVGNCRLQSTGVFRGGATLDCTAKLNGRAALPPYRSALSGRRR
jgi:hypothetical protein